MGCRSSTPTAANDHTASNPAAPANLSDESFESPPAATRAWEQPPQPPTRAARTRHRAQATSKAAVSGHWQVEASASTWHPLDKTTGQQLLNAYASGEQLFLYSLGELSYEVDFRTCTQTNRHSGVQQRIRWVPFEDALHTVAYTGSTGGSLQETVYQWQLKNGAYVDFDDDDKQHFLQAWSLGSNTVRYVARGFEYEVDFFMMIQKNLSTGIMRQMRVKPREAVKMAPDVGGRSRCHDSSTYDARRAEAGNVGNSGGRASRSQPGVPRSNPDRFSHSRSQKKFSLDPSGARPDPASEGPSASSNDAPRGVAEEQTAAAELPEGVAWPGSEGARRAAERLFAELVRLGARPLEERRVAYKAACLHWHPDKNLDQEDLATEVFQFLQNLKAWYFAC